MTKRVRKSTTGTKKTATTKTSSNVKKTSTKSSSSTKKAPVKKNSVTSNKTTPVKKTPVKKTPVKKTTPPTKKVISSKKSSTGNVKKTTTQSVKNKTYEYVRVSENAKNARFVEMGERVQKGELKWSYYAIDGNVGYHYYRKLK